MGKTFGQFRQSDPLITHFHIQEQSSLPTIYCDMDGVLCDFKRGISNMFSLKSKDPSMPGPMQMSGFSTPQEWFDAPMSRGKWEPVVNYKLFWPSLPWTEDGKRLWAFISKFKPHILSAYTPDDPNCIPGKRTWLRKNVRISSNRVNLVRRVEKQKFAMKSDMGRAPAILIDDFPRNIDQFKAAGGMGIVHTSTSNTLRELKKLGF